MFTAKLKKPFDKAVKDSIEQKLHGCPNHRETIHLLILRVYNRSFVKFFGVLRFLDIFI